MKLAVLSGWVRRHALKAIPVGVFAASFAMGGELPGRAEASGTSVHGAPNEQVQSARTAPSPGATTALAPAHADAKSKDGEGMVYLNEATVSELMALPGIGAKRAQAILDLRERRGGRFKSVDEIVRVKGIGPKMLARLKARLALARAPDPTAQDAAKTAMATKSATK